jgi:two-component system, OmpR family, phosphate regulon sensor histidine kinase PhoR
MSHSIYWKIIVPIILLIILCLGCFGWYTVNTVRNTEISHLRSTLQSEAILVADISLPYFTEPGNNNLDKIAKTNGEAINSRITIIALDGTVLGDSWEDPKTLENHAARQEVIEALSSTGVGQSIRYSSTTRQDMMYVAVPISVQGKTVGVARVSLPLISVNSIVSSDIWTIVWAVIIVTILIILTAALITYRIIRPVRRVTGAIENVASGKMDQQIEIQSEDELGRLSYAFNKMASNIKDTLTAVSDERSKLSSVLSGITDGVVMVDSGEKILLANPAAELIFNFAEKNVIGQPLIEIIFNYEIEQLFKKSISSSQKQIASIDTSLGQFLRVIAVPLKTDKISGGLLIFQDLTEMRSLQTMRREFVGNVSHELRTPLAGIKAIVETLQDGAIEDRPAARDFLNKMNFEVDKMTQMVTELIELTRIETGKAKLNMEYLDLNSIIAEVISRLTPQAQRKDITITTSIKEKAPLVQADRERMQQVISNIIHNAVKFTPQNGTILVETDYSPTGFSVFIKDSGIGISKEDLPHIFERFFKADKSRSQSGSGLGLAIAKHIVQEHGGKIWVESQEGKGTTFGIDIPLRNA